MGLHFPKQKNALRNSKGIFLFLWSLHGTEHLYLYTNNHKGFVNINLWVGIEFRNYLLLNLKLQVNTKNNQIKLGGG
jgi:hypothetical protein